MLRVYKPSWSPFVPFCSLLLPFGGFVCPASLSLALLSHISIDIGVYRAFGSSPCSPRTIRGIHTKNFARGRNLFIIASETEPVQIVLCKCV